MPPSRSLPLMGIGNDRRVDLCAAVLASLTTPHGDREPRRSSGSSSRPRPSLPLMGIGNAGRRRGGEARGGAHYPSWGSGTRGGGDRRNDRRRLTTPHGDRERCMRGFALVFVLASLPLMGIGNRPKSFRATPPAVSSLPLMGIGNVPVIEVLRRDLRLTTPHGDREPDLLDRLARPADDSLPLMGIGNMSMQQRTAVVLAPHYPSWGSGTAGDGGVQRAAVGPHYPSWGSGTTGAVLPPRR